MEVIVAGRVAGLAGLDIGRTYSFGPMGTLTLHGESTVGLAIRSDTLLLR